MIDKSRFGFSSAQSSPLDALCSSVLQGLHSAAQPLTILRASLNSERTNRMSICELRELVTSSAIEVERVCLLFSTLKHLVAVEGVKPHVSATPLLTLLAEAVDGVDLIFRKDGIVLSSIVPDSCQPVQIDKARTLQAMSIVLLVAHGLSRAQETVGLVVSSSSSNFVRVVVQNLDSSLESMSAEAKLSMALAEANFRSQLSAFSWSLNPFTVQIEFQTAPSVTAC